MRADRLGPILAAIVLALSGGVASAEGALALRGTGDLGLVVERAAGRVQLIETTGRTSLGAIDGLGDLSHASIVYSRDGRFAFVFGRDGGLTKVDLLECAIAKRVVQAGNSIGGAISQDGSLVAVSWSRSPTSRPAMGRTTPAPRWSVWSTRPAGVSCSACTMPARSGSLT